MSSELKAMEPAKSSYDQEWVIQISRALEEDLQDINAEVSIFSVPKTLVSLKPDAYTPQLIALGPYHHQRPELFEMEHHKLTSAKRVQKNLQQIKFCHMVNHIAQSDSTVRSCYHRFLEFDQETLAWIFAIDASFLLEYLQTYSPETEEGSLMRISSKMAHLIDYTRRKTAHHAILRDVIKLENQIPLFLLREVHSFYPGENHDEVFATMLMGFCKDLSPIKYINFQCFREDCFWRAHLLQLLYHMVAPKLQLVPDCSEQEKPKEDEEIGWFRKALKSFLTAVFYINLVLLRLLRKIYKSKAVTFLATLPFKIIFSYVFHLRNKGDINNFISSAGSVAEEVESTSHEMEVELSPLVEEIAIPSVTQLHKIGVKFCPAKGGLESINFDKSSCQFYLPVIHLDDNSEIVLRNLVAYEACIAPEMMVFTRYTELMNGIIDDEEDVRILREAGIILNRLKSDGEVATLWNGMTKSVRETKVPILDKAIEGANTYYSESWKVRMNGTMKKYVFASWPCLTFLAANILILMSTLQAACSVYNCSKWMEAP
ncbi:putative UPF0481 protein At3g02645 [Corylus avellana]|uniref:putative UPF0481 protein At3g02645 n=1 Tax=Corylus avellana TaxID=13451 RepID=UPI00286D04BE|nr:putative UPF0481 protein At3g02645 [Corylus avellana]